MRDAAQIIVAFLILIGIVYLFARPFYRPRKKEISCPNCKYTGLGKYRTKGSFFIELVLWLCFIVPGLIYSAWRVTSRKFICPQCDYEYVVKT